MIERPGAYPDTDVPQEKLTGAEAAAKVTWALAHGEGLRTADVVALTGMTRSGAYDVMQRISRVIPIYQEEGSGVWQVLAFRELSSS